MRIIKNILPLFCLWITFSCECGFLMNNGDKNVAQDSLRAYHYISVSDSLNKLKKDSARFYLEKAKILASFYVDSVYLRKNDLNNYIKIRSLANFKQGKLLIDSREFGDAFLSLQKAQDGFKEIQSDSLLLGTYFEIARGSYLSGKVDSARVYFKKSVDLCRNTGTSFGLFRALNGLGIIYIGEGNYIEAYDVFSESLKLAENSRKEEEIAVVCGNIGTLYLYKGEYKECISFFQRALTYFEKTNDAQGRSKMYNNLGIVYKKLSEWDKAEEFYLKSIDLNKENGNLNVLAKNYLNIGNIRTQKDELRSALDYYEESLKLRDKLKDEVGKASVYRNIGEVYFLLNNNTKAAEYYNKSREIFSKYNKLHYEASVLNSLANLNFKEGRVRSAIKLAKECIDIAEDQEMLPLVSQGYSSLSEFYEGKSDFEKALESYKQYKVLNDSIFTLNKSQQIADLELGFENQRKEKELKEKDAKIAYEKARMEKKQFQIWLLFLNMIIMGIFLVFLIRSVNLRRKAIAELEQKKEEIESANDKLQTANETIAEQRDIISEKHRVSENKRKETEEELLSLLDNSEDRIYFNGLLHGTSKTNSFFYSCIGYSQAEYDNLGPEALIHPADYLQYMNCVNGRIYGADSKTFEYRTMHKNGEWLHMMAKTVVMRDETSSVISTLTVSRDISELKKYENKLIKAKNKAEESDRLKSAFLANMSHEIRTPMNAIVGFSSLLDDSTLEVEERAEFVDLIKTNSNQLLSLINDILDISKIESGQIQICKSEFSLNDELQELEAIFLRKKEQLGKSNIQLEFIKPDDAAVYTDRTRFRQIFTNMLDNALKFTIDGMIECGYKVLHEKIIFYVKDTGIGISDDDKPLIFEHFRQLEESSSRKFGGVGLGLPISRNLAILLGGDIWLDSVEGAGTTFYFSLPRNEAETPVKSASEEFSTEIPDFEGLKILVIDDTPSVSRFFSFLLRKTKAQVILAGGGEEGLSVIYNQPDIDIVFCDIQMPEMSGFEVLAKIKESRPDLFVVAQTAHALAGDREKFEKAGFDDYISKPIDQSKLYLIVAELVLESK